ncbi:MAG: DUF4912 domain-containing protein, partial [Chthoniobacterales bacterium]
HIESEIEVTFEARNWYLPAAHANSLYFVELGYYRDSAWQSIGRSNSIQTPPDCMSEDDSLDYAALPLHITFQRMLEELTKLKNPDEPLITALSRLRKEGKLSGLDTIFPNEESMSKALLEMLLGQDLAKQIADGAVSSDQAEALLQEKLRTTISSGKSSELFNLTGESLSSGQLFSLLSSWNEAGFSSWIKSLPEAPSISSFSEFREAVSSWLEHASSSWSPEALSSWSLSSLSSWGGSEGSSWEGSRGFFMNVNAEVIFYGGTDPRAKVWIDGEPIQLAADGTFRYHFRFANDDYEIPIVAESPDGVEKRSATLHFKRQTQTSGGVDATAQPPHLIPPMGAKK